jgi:hypothetical protein
MFETYAPVEVESFIMEKVFGNGLAVWKDFVDYLLVINYLFTTAIIPTASNLTWLVDLPVLIYSRIAYLKPSIC